MIGCDGATDAPASTSAVASLSGEQLFTGLVLGNGEAAAALPEVWNAPQILKARSESVVEASAEAEMDARVVDAIAAADPTFFSRFETAITSGRHTVIREAMQEAGSAVGKVVLEDPAFGLQASDGTSKSTVVATAEANCVIVIVAYAAVVIWDWKWGPDEEIAEERQFADAPVLRQDEVIDLIATRFAAR